MTVYGYVRVSTDKQSVDRQTRNIEKAYPDTSGIYIDRWTGTEMERPEWTRLLRKVKSGDVIVFDSVSRMSRTASEGIETYMRLLENGIELVFLKERHIDTQTYKKALSGLSLPEIKTGQKSADTLVSGIFSAVEQYMYEVAKMQIEIAFEQSEKEVQDLRQRTREGIQTAKLSGKAIGRPVGSGHTYQTKKEKKMLPLIEKLSRSFGGALSDSECMQTLGLSQTTYYKYKKKIRTKVT